MITIFKQVNVIGQNPDKFYKIIRTISELLDLSIS